MIHNILKQQGVKSLNKLVQKSITGGYRTSNSGVRRCRTTSDCRNSAPEGFCMNGYCFI